MSADLPNSPSRPTSLEHEVYLSLQRVALSLSYDAAEFFRAHHLSAPQFNILRILRGAAERGAREGLACGEIGERLLAHAPDLTRLLDRMALQGLVVRTRGSSDRRVVKTQITERGLVVLAELDAPLLELHRRQLGHLGEERLGALQTLLEYAQSPIPVQGVSE